MAYFQLACGTCNEVYLPLCATSEEELLNPDWEHVEEAMGQRQADRFNDWFRQHCGHGLTVRSANAEEPQPVETVQKSTNG